MDEIAILIPCYNESKTIAKVVSDWKTAIPSSTVYVYDNNSRDGTDELARQAGAIVRYEFSQGKGNVVRRMFREIDAKCYIMIDGDDTYPAEFGAQMADEVLKNGYDMVVGDRLSSTYFTENKRPFHNLGNTLVRTSINQIFKTNIKDVMTGYRAFSYMFVKTFPVLSSGFEIETEMSIHAVDKKMAIQNTVITYRDRPEGSFSKLNTVRDGIKVLGTIVRLFRDYMPFTFFGFFSLLLFILAAVFFLPVFLEYLNTGFVLRFPTLIVSGLAALAGLLSFFTGLILHTLICKNKQDFEFKLQLIKYQYDVLCKHIPAASSPDIE